MSNRFVVPLTLPELLGQLPASLRSTWALWNRDLTWPVAAILLVGFGAAEVGELRQRRLPLGLLSVTVCLGLALLQRVAPFERVWLFLLPLYLAIASVGLVKLVTIGAARLREGRAGRIPDRLGLAAAALVAAGLAVSTVSSGSINRSDETGAFVDAEAVARALTARLEPEDAVMSTMPASMPELQYYFPRLGLPASTLVRAPEEAQHLYVVTAPPATVIVSGWGRPEQIDQFTQSVLLELGRL